MNHKSIGFLSAAFLSFNSLAGTDCVTLSGGWHLIAGQVDWNSLPHSAIVQMPTGWTIDPSYQPCVLSPATGWTCPQPPPGYGYLCNLRTNAEVCFTNDLVPVLPLQLASGFSLLCCQTNGPATFEAIVGRPPEPGAGVFRLRPGGFPGGWLKDLNETNYYIYTFADGAWFPEPPVVDTGEAVWIYQPPTTTNLQMAAGVFSFDALTPRGRIATVEYTENLQDPGTWLVLTNLAGIGVFSNVVDPADATAITQRFYRVNLHE